MRPDLNAYIVSGLTLALIGVMLALGVARRHRRQAKLTHAWCR